MIDYYYEFQPGSKMYRFPYGFIRGYHPEDSSEIWHALHGLCWVNSRRVWLENANGMILVKDRGREVHERINGQEVTWIKLQARELEL